MEAGKDRIFPQEFKLEAPEMSKFRGKIAGQIERILGITPGLLHKWRYRDQILEHEVRPARTCITDCRHWYLVNHSNARS